MINNYGQHNNPFKNLELFKYEVEGSIFYATREYEIDLQCGIIGKGRYGQVVLAKREGNMHQPPTYVAIKRIGLYNKNEYLGQVVRELKLHSELKHENIVNLVDIMPISEKNPECIEIVMEKMDGTLRSRLTERSMALKNAPIHEKPKIFEQIHMENRIWMLHLLRGLTYIHNHKIVHRDMKPENIMLRDVENQVSILKIGDFGQSKRGEMENSGMSHAQIITPAYRPPELVTTNVNEHQFSKSVDLWAAGCIFTELLMEQNLISETRPHDALKALRKRVGITDEILAKYFEMSKVSNNRSTQTINSIRLQPEFDEHAQDYLVSEFGWDAIDLLLKLLAPKELRYYNLDHPYISGLPVPPNDETKQFSFQCVEEPDKRIELLKFVKQYNEIVQKRSYDSILILSYTIRAYKCLMNQYNFYMSNFTFQLSKIAIFNLKQVSNTRNTFAVFDQEREKMYQIVLDEASSTTDGQSNMDFIINKIQILSKCPIIQQVKEIIHLPQQHKLTRIYDLYPFGYGEFFSMIKDGHSEFIIYTINMLFQDLAYAIYTMQRENYCHFNIHLGSLRFIWKDRFYFQLTNMLEGPKAYSQLDNIKFQRFYHEKFYYDRLPSVQYHFTHKIQDLLAMKNVFQHIMKDVYPLLQSKHHHDHIPFNTNCFDNTNDLCNKVQVLVDNVFHFVSSQPAPIPEELITKHAQLLEQLGSFCKFCTQIKTPKVSIYQYDSNHHGQAKSMRIDDEVDQQLREKCFIDA